jgi:hypothetical protein
MRAESPDKMGPKAHTDKPRNDGTITKGTSRDKVKYTHMIVCLVIYDFILYLYHDQISHCAYSVTADDITCTLHVW